MHNPENIDQIRTNEVSHLKETNEIQMMLIMRKLGDSATEDEMESWVVSNSKRVREIFDSMVEENPAVLDDWKDPVKRNDILERIERELYVEDDVELAA